MDEKVPYIVFEGEMARHAQSRRSKKVGSKAMRDYSRSELTTAIDEWILNERDRAIMMMAV